MKIHALYLNKNKKGFTLIEIMIVLTIMVLIVSLAVPSVSSFFQVSLNSAARNLAGVSKEAFHASLISGKVYRVVFDIKKAAYWVESTLSFVALNTKESKERLERRKKVVDQALESAFTLDTSITKKHIDLPVGVVFEDVITEKDSKPIVEGFAMNHFFPYGLSEQIIIHLKDSSKHHVSLVVSPTTGNTEVYGYYVEPQEVVGK